MVGRRTRRWTHRAASILACAVALLLGREAMAQDDFHQRPPLTWEEIERSFRRFADVDLDPAWARAWPAIEEAYLAFLAEEESRRETGGRAIAEAFAPVLIGVATPEEVDRLEADWEAHRDRCDRAEDEFLRSLERLTPPSAPEAARDALRERRLARVMSRAEGNAPEMPRLIGTILDAELGRVFDAEIGAESRRRAREAVRAAEEAMLAPVTSLIKASAVRRGIVERAAAEEAWFLRAGAPTDEAARAERLKVIHDATAAAVARPTAEIGEAHASIERIGVQAALGLLGTLDGAERRRALRAMGTPRFSFALDATMRWCEGRLASIERRFPPTEAARTSIEEATARFRDATDEMAMQAFKGLRDDAALVGRHLLDIDAGRPSSWLAARNERLSKESEAFDAALKRWSDLVRAALGVPKESRWPRHDRKPDGEPIVEEPTAEEAAERTLNDERRGIDSGIGDGAVLVHPLPDEASVAALAARLGLDQATRSAWLAARASREREWTETVAADEESIRSRLFDESLDDAAEVDRCRALVARADGLRRSLHEDLIRALPEASRDAMERVVARWSRSLRLPDGQTACRRVRGLSGGEEFAGISALDWVGHPLEALERTELTEPERTAVEAAVDEASKALVAADEAMGAAEAYVAVARIGARAQALWNEVAPIERRRAAWEESKTRRAEVLQVLAPAVRGRAKASAALRAAILAALPEARREAFVRTSVELALPGIDRERPRFERPMLAALGMTGHDAERSAAMIGLFTAWDRRWTERTEAIARVGDGSGYLVVVAGGAGSLASGRALHASAMVHWMELRRQQESMVALHAAARLLTADERGRLPRW